ncbi:MAG: hypothetical protein HPY71_03860 [Firmicutes bacterium]|nr:hypothetical protein [Bacillota bacterium]
MIDEGGLLNEEREIAARVLSQYHAERLARVISKATEACRGVLVAYEELEKAGLNEKADSVVWADRVHEFFVRLSKVEAVLSEREALNGIGEALNALMRGGDADVGRIH